MPLISSHIQFAQDLCDSIVNSPSEDGFLIGNILPDIRYISNISREITHISFHDTNSFFEKINEIKNKHLDSFDKSIEAGTLLHSFIDEWWRKNIYIKSESKFIGLALQLVDEEYSFNSINRDEVIKKINGKNFSYLNISDEIIKKWILFVSKYLSRPNFDIEEIIQMISGIKQLDTKSIEEIINLTKELKNNSELNKKIQDLKIKIFSIVQDQDLL